MWGLGKEPALRPAAPTGSDGACGRARSPGCCPSATTPSTGSTTAASAGSSARSRGATGLNAATLPAGARWVAVEPNAHFHDRIRAAAARHGLSVEVVGGTAEALPLADGAADAVVSTLVLCSVSDVAGALAEARRVLRPGGRFVFLEHVAAAPKTALRRAQRLLRGPWGLVADGCRPDQETEPMIRAAGFASVETEAFRVPGGLVAPHVMGVATA